MSGQLLQSDGLKCIYINQLKENILFLIKLCELKIVLNLRFDSFKPDEIECANWKSLAMYVRIRRGSG